MERIDGRLAISVVLRRRHACMGDVPRCRLLRHLCQAAVALLQQCQHVAARHIVRAELVARPVVQVAHVGIVAHRVVKLQHRVVGLQEGQFGESRLHGGIVLVVHVARQLHRAHKGAVVHGVAARVHALQVLVAVQQGSVVFHADALDAHTFHVHALADHRLPANVRTAGIAQRFHRPPVLQRQSAFLQFRQVLQSQRLDVAAQFGGRQRTALGKQHRLDVHAASVQRRQSRLVPEVQFRAAQRASLRTRLTVQVHVGQLAALVQYQTPAGAAAPVRLQVKHTQHLALVQVQVTRQVVRRSLHVQFGNAARAVDSYRVVHREGVAEHQRHRAAFLGLLARLQVGGVVRAVAEVVEFARLHHDGVGRLRRLAAHIHVYVVREIVARLILRVEQGEAVLDEPVAECLLVTLQGVDIRVLHDAGLRRHTLRLGLDILDLAALVVSASAPVALLLLVKHLVHLFLGQLLSHRRGHRLDLILEVGQYQAPQPRVVTLKSVFVLVAVPRLSRHVVQVCQHRVVAVAYLGVAVVIQQIPHQRIPRRGYHVLRPLVHVGEVVREQPPAQQEVQVQVLAHLRLELARYKGAYIARCRACRHTVPNPAPQTLEGVFLRRRRVGPLRVLTTRLRRVVELQGVVKLRCRLRVQVALSLEQAQRLRVVQELEGDGFCRREAVHAFHADDSLPVALVVVQVVLAVVGRRVLQALCREHVDRKTVHGCPHVAVHLLRRGQEPQRLHQVIPQFRAAGVLSH